MDGSGVWTLDELAELVATALSADDYAGAPTGRVRDVPDQRAIRWYVTKGLVDRPVGSRGRVALYGRRHLLQLVAIKRLQAAGRSLSQIQAGLTGATDHALAAVARLPAGLPAAPAVVAHQRVAEPRARFWTTPAPAPTPAVAAASDAAGVNVRAVPEGRAVPDSVVMQGIRLAPGVMLLIENGAVDAAAVLAAARPLLDLLAAGGPACEEEL
jgi:DNA-binding transcriptional MerR regulator